MFGVVAPLLQVYIKLPLPVKLTIELTIPLSKPAHNGSVGVNDKSNSPSLTKVNVSTEVQPSTEVTVTV